MSTADHKYAFDDMKESNPGYITAFVQKANAYLENDIDDCWVEEVLDELLPKHPDNIDLLGVYVSLQGLGGMLCNTVDAYQKICNAEPTFENRFSLAEALVESVEFDLFSLGSDTPKDIVIQTSKKSIQQSLMIIEELAKETTDNNWRSLIDEIVERAHQIKSQLTVL